ncbi:MAG: oxidoreductase [Nonomuraea muscovyensis]|jgi:NAD(P)-dependent dehydrogenase (short-subunit alcohol dehydrogenase family)|nr:oxidoreductase [Nonomuraea muscovyensis]
MDELDGKVAIVTGGGSLAAGIGNGRAAAVRLAESGARVVIVDVADRNMAETQELIAERGGECLCVRGDVSLPDDCAAIVRRAVETWGRVDVLVNNVGVAGPPGTAVDVDLDAWDACLRVNVTSMMLMSRFAIPRMRAVGGGSIVNLSSAAGLVGGHPSLAYSTAKGAIVNLTRSMAAAHGPDGIRVNAVAPGYMYTPNVYAQGLSEDDRERRRLAAPLRTEGTGWDVGEAVLFLAGGRSRWITGVVLPVDAGLTSALAVPDSMTVQSPRPR